MRHCYEACIVGKKGKFTTDLKDITRTHNVNNLFYHPIEEPQSKKPDTIYEMIEEFVPNAHYLELFGR